MSHGTHSTSLGYAPAQHGLRLDDLPGGRLRWPAVWLRLGGHRRAKPFYEAYFSITDPAQSGWAMSSALVGCVLGPPSPAGRRIASAQEAADPGRHPVHHLGMGYSSCQQLRSVCYLSYRGDRHRSGLRPLAHVHRRDKSSRQARQVRRHQPAHHCHRCAGGPAGQPDDRRSGREQCHSGRYSGDLERPVRLALDVRGRTGTCAGVSGTDVLRAGVTALAGQRWPV